MVPAIPGGIAARTAQIVATVPFVLMQGKLPVGAAKDFQCIRPGHSLGGELPDGIEGDDGPAHEGPVFTAAWIRSMVILESAACDATLVPIVSASCAMNRCWPCAHPASCRAAYAFTFLQVDHER